MGMFDSLFGGGGSPEIKMPDINDYLPLIESQLDYNQPTQTTPFGGVNYGWTNNPLSETDWLSQNPDITTNITAPSTFNQSIYDSLEPGDARQYLIRNPREGRVTTNTGKDGTYQSYLEGFDKGPRTAEAYLSPELQSIFTKQFSPDAYSEYGDDYMNNAKRYLDPVYDRQRETFEQTMANRGQPVGGELYDDTFGNLMDAQNKGWENAAFGANQAGENARLQDYNRLMTAMGLSTVDTPKIDVIGPANTALNLNAQNAQNQANSSNSIWNTAANLGGAYLMGAPDSSWLWG